MAHICVCSLCIYILCKFILVYLVRLSKITVQHLLKCKGFRTEAKTITVYMHIPSMVLLYSPFKPTDGLVNKVVLILSHSHTLSSHTHTHIHKFAKKIVSSLPTLRSSSWTFQPDVEGRLLARSSALVFV